MHSQSSLSPSLPILSHIPPTHDKPQPNPTNTTLHFKDPNLSLLQLCSSMQELKQLHARLIISGTARQTIPLSRLLAFAALSPSGDLRYARLLFDHSETSPNTFIWSTMIRAYSKSTAPELGFEFYMLMLESGVVPEDFTVPFVLNACAEFGGVREGRVVQGQVLKLGLDLNVFVQNALVRLYLCVGDFGSAHKVFDQIPEVPSEVAWNMLIDGYGKAGEAELAHQLFEKMPNRGLTAWNSVVGAYARCGLLDIARRLFDGMPRRNIVSWNTLIGGYVSHGEFKEGLVVLHEMQRQNVKPDKVTLALVISACGDLRAIEQGKWLHNYIIECKIDINVYLGTSLIHMYAKIGFIDCARKVFDEMPTRDVLTWNAMIGSLAMHGLGNEALSLFSKMESTGVLPNEITFLGILSACNHAGLVEEGLWHFNSMTQNYNIEATDKHYACMVDLFGRAGMFKEAEELIQSMPRKPGASVWGALLGASKIHGDVDIGKHAWEHLIELEPHSDGRYIVLSNVYATSGDWTRASSVRRLMKDRGIKKTPGCSWIEVDGRVHEFLAGDGVHPQA
ncbi:pentatricopeptide repeat-containing protein At2g29760, chloroplastic-like [Magnolia sinica]|uniref:pentatricopeptide repeat-containing protein At2g29760, chloroplastic-like n=1 Tax=Magnolia sinica TaxID=86752 RepID=UPI002659AB79|nr:pentatricopeptide repeat-containing protein At2g29760, chloroplastic-like [Magnolia sinica]